MRACLRFRCLLHSVIAETLENCDVARTRTRMKKKTLCQAGKILNCKIDFSPQRGGSCRAGPTRFPGLADTDRLSIYFSGFGKILRWLILVIKMRACLRFRGLLHSVTAETLENCDVARTRTRMKKKTVCQAGKILNCKIDFNPQRGGSCGAGLTRFPGLAGIDITGLPLLSCGSTPYMKHMSRFPQSPYSVVHTFSVTTHSYPFGHDPFAPFWFDPFASFRSPPVRILSVTTRSHPFGHDPFTSHGS
ncbi:hypothetical protein F2Q68_00044773 [Brassica cretica]|uniref:Secreted protein n=1 Tax=Brassica cretica TaxID=69181 RepID=A0A8S9LIK3_BRACR|nr:hypothetical protein F2Q68_00044773 [Brassica cretica]